MLKKLILLALAGGGLMAPHAASAQATGTLNVSLHVESGCELAIGNDTGTGSGGTAVGTLAFPTVTAYGTGGQVPDDESVIAQVGSDQPGAANTFTINCGGNATLTPTVALSAGGNAGAGTQRFLANGAVQIAYDLYRDAARTDTPWEPGVAQAITLDGNGRGAVPIYAVAHDVSTSATLDGDYTDTVTLTLTY